MASHLRISIACAIGGVLLAVGAATADPRPGEAPPSGDADSYRSKAQQTLAGQVQALRAHDEAWQSLSPAEREQALESAREKAEQESAEMIGAAVQAEARTAAVDTCPLRGLRYPDREPAVDVPFHDWEFIVLDYWGGLLQGECVGIYAGYRPADPLQGELVVYSHPEEPSRYEVYPTPTATGPVHIVSEAHGVLILSSVWGTFDRHTDTATPEGSTFESTPVPGGATYTFDLNAMRYR
jgi:hypothetical protein